MTTSHRLIRLRQSATGISITEFGLIAPVVMTLLMGALDLGHTLYMQAVLQGAVQKAARDAGLEAGGTSAKQTEMDTAITAQVQRLARNATVTISRNYFRDYTKAAVRTKEPFTDTNGNGTCNGGEPYEDSNNSTAWDIDNGRVGQGGAKDNVILSTQVSYPRLFPFMRVVGLPSTVTMNATTVLVNQPYGDQAAVVVRNCP